MLKKIINWMLIAAVMIIAVPAGAAFALPGDQAQEQVIKQEVIVGYFDIWKGDNWLDTNNDGPPDEPGQTDKLTKPFNYSASDKLDEWQITRVEVSYPFTLDEYTTAGGRPYGPDGKLWVDPGTGQQGIMSWLDFQRNYLDYLPQNLSAQIVNQDLSTGSASVEWGLDLPDPPENALDLKNPQYRQYIGYEPSNIGSMVEGWRWYLPAIITWYGVPKEQEMNLAVTITSPPEEALAGEAITVTGEITSDSDTPITTLVQWYLGSKKVYEGNVTIDKTKDLHFPFTMPDSSTLVTVQVNPGHNQPPDETTWDDNKDSVTINLSAPVPPPVIQTGSGLTFQAVSQYSVVTGKPDTGNSIRQPNTARWTDTVTAYLRPLKVVSSVSGNDAIDYTIAVAPPKPDIESECGTASYNQLDDYSITATLIYPKQNPRYTFGDPVPPKGTDQNYDFKHKLPPSGSTLTTELAWKSQEQAAVGQFKEMWAENGANVESIMHPELNSWIKSPQEYMLTASNISVTVKYTTHYNVRHCPEHGL
ncbi:hypothetical protein SAMN05660649_00294 [Desulfotomaculum arcticum]|uniref:Uncharacterized protein n=1 Tax=Desulfotruncus arcticus DSM 17038 TaxID=1121424 RepID=A0A1I2N1V2_9FIRM|nr:hypothetical protein [Desulfotruncus arcticus]SFF97623.1 hypothetical protein SAMN05660649_00294 [Desulfotomaculum arcticum] [Desulfotruncus arcticus DSM 17038]